MSFEQQAVRGWLGIGNGPVERPIEQGISYWIPSCDIKGKLPSELKGTVFRNGPSSLFVHGQRLAHPIDGDGLIVAVTFTGQHVHFKARPVQTRTHIAEQQAKRLLFRGQMGTRVQSWWRNTFDLMKSKLSLSNSSSSLPESMQFREPANTNVFYWSGKLLATYETSLPYVLDPRSLETLGKDAFQGALEKVKACAAHFRHDTHLNRLVTLSVKAGVPPRLPTIAFFEWDDQWQLKSEKLLHIKDLNYAHDFLLTRHFYLVQMTPFVEVSTALAWQFVLGVKAPGEVMEFSSEVPCHIVVIPRQISSSAHSSQANLVLDGEPWRLFQLMPCHIYHFGHVTERDAKGKVIDLSNDTAQPHSLELDAVCLAPPFNMSFQKELWLSNVVDAPGQHYQMKIQLNQPRVETRRLSPDSVEFPATHPFLHGRGSGRFVYLMAALKNPLPFSAVTKVDITISQPDKARIDFWESGGVCGEPIFIPHPEQQSEDQGWIVVQVYRPLQDVTEFCVLDARHLSQGPIASIPLRHRVPYGFHGTWTPLVFENELQAKL